MKSSTAGLHTEPQYATEHTGTDRPVRQVHTSRKQWAIVLAGGRGERMRQAISEWMGGYRPKQFCRFAGDRTMIESTWDRARQIVSPKHIVTVSVADQAPYFDEMDIDCIPGTLLYQPDNNGTAAAIYLALSHILAIEPEASVIIMPSDHFIFPESRFVALASQALQYTSADPDHLILLAAEASWPNPEFGWIEPKACRTGFKALSEIALQPVAAFFEKPDSGQAQHLFDNSALWSTMIIAAKGQLLWQLAERLQPKFFLCFAYMHRLTRELQSGNRLQDSVNHAILKTFQHMAALDFSRDLLQNVPQQCLLLPMTDIDWDDWGRPERILQCIKRYGLESSLGQVKQTIC